MSDPKPAFQIILPDKTVQKIWANGKTEGFGGDIAVINRIPLMLSEAYAQGKDSK